VAGFWNRVDEFDARVEQGVARFRGPRFDYVFYTASFLGDHGLVWVLLAGLRYLTGIGGDDVARFAAIRAVTAEIGQAALVNLGIKSLFRRKRPVVEFDRPYHLRVPRTTSFPSGHATAAFTAALLLADGTPWGWFLFPLAATIAFSRVYVRIHHMSDVLGGVIIGLLLGLAVKTIFPLP
jgi:undecaprenyl-diphosphatase